MCCVNEVLCIKAVAVNYLFLTFFVFQNFEIRFNDMGDYLFFSKIGLLRLIYLFINLINKKIQALGIMKISYFIIYWYSIKSDNVPFRLFCVMLNVYLKSYLN